MSDPIRRGRVLIGWHPEFWAENHEFALDLRDEPDDEDDATPEGLILRLERIADHLSAGGRLDAENLPVRAQPPSTYRTRSFMPQRRYTTWLGTDRCCRIYFAVTEVRGEDVSFPGIDFQLDVYAFTCTLEEHLRPWIAGPIPPASRSAG